MRQRPIIEALEPRILYSADLGPVSAPGVLGPSATEQRLLDTDAQLASQTEQAAQNILQEVVFIDPRVPDAAQLIDDINAQSGRQVEIITLDAERDGLAQIAEALAGREDVSAVHIIGHGGDGVIQLGNRIVTAGTLEANAGLVGIWGNALTADADILLYGCDVAATEQGRLLVDALARITGADVSASDDATGHASLGGDWNLEYATGGIEAPVALSQAGQDAWSHLLPDTLLIDNTVPFGDMVDGLYEIRGGVTYTQSFSYTSGSGTYSVSQVDLVLYRNPTPAGGNITIEIRRESDNRLETTGAVDRKSLATSEAWVSISFPTLLNGPLVDGTSYLITIKGTGGGNVFVGVDETGTYAGVTHSFNDDGTPELTKDMAFVLWESPKPILDLNGAAVGQDVNATFFEQTPVLIAPSATIVDPDSANLSSMTVTLTTRPDTAAESLSLNAAAEAARVAAGLTLGSYDSTTGVLSISGSALLATYQTILQGVLYNNTSDAPTTSERTVTVVVADGSVPSNLSVARTSFITVTAVNDAPVLTPIAPLFTTITEDQTTNSGEMVATLLGTSVTDVDAGALEGIAITDLVSGNGTWEFSLDGGTSWSAVGAVSNTSALLLRDTDRVRFVPNGQNADAGSVTYRAWDRSGGLTAGTKVDTSTNGGSTAFSIATDTASITVTAVNDAPVLAPIAPSFTTITEDQTTNAGDTVATLVGVSISDVDTGAVEGIAVTGLVSGNGTWQFSLDNGTTWSAVGVVANNSALLLRDTDRLRFVPDGANADAGSVTYRAWDRTSGTVGTKVDASVNGGTTAFSMAIDTASITVTALNDAPVLAGANNLAAIAEDQTGSSGTLVSALIAGQVSDADTGALSGIAVTAVDNTNGSWEYSTNGGALWTAFGSPTGSTARLLAADASTYVRFVPAADFNGTVSGGIVFRAWDQSSGSAGGTADTSVNGSTTAFSSATASSSITVTAVNDAPVNTVPAAQIGNEDTNLVFSSAGGNAISIADVDAGTNPVQVTLTGTNGTITLASLAGLTFTGGGNGTATMTFTGTVADINTALDGLVFMPNLNFSGAASLSITTNDLANTGAGGALNDTDVVPINVLPNVAPTVTASGGTTSFVEGANVTSTPVAVDSGVTVSDPDSLTMSSATVSIGAGWQAAEDVLAFTNDLATMGNVAGSFNAASGVLTLNSAGSTATLAQWQAALRSVTYTNLSDTPSTASRTVSFVVTGQGGTSASSAHTVSVTAVNDVPAVTVSGSTTTYVTERVPMVVDAGVTTADVDNTTLASARVSISGGFLSAEDVLSFTAGSATTGNIAGSYDSASGVLTLSSAGATATVAEWQAALRTVTYTNTSFLPTNGTRTVSFELNDGTAVSSTAALPLVVNVPELVVVLPPSPPPVTPPPVTPPPVSTTPPPSEPPATTPTAPAQQPVQPGGGTVAGLDAEFLTPVVNANEAPVTLADERSRNPATSGAGTPGFRVASVGVAQAASATNLLNNLLGDVLRLAESRQIDLFNLDQQGRSSVGGGFVEELARIEENLQEQDEFQTRTVATLTAGSLSMTVAYLLWLIRGGALAASMLSALPAWRYLDPLPILSRMNDEEDGDDGEDDEQAIASFADEPPDTGRA